jgi:hypothetical protein
MRFIKRNGDPTKAESKKPAGEREQAILDYLNQTGTYERRRNKIKFPRVTRVEDYGIGRIMPFADPYGMEFVPEEKRTTEDILGYLKDYYENPGVYGYNVGRESILPKEGSLLTDYEEIIHGGQAPSMFKIDKTFGKKVGKKKREFLKVASDAFKGTDAEEYFKDFRRYSDLGLPNMEAEAKPMAMKLAMRDYGVIDDYTLSDSDLDSIREWYVSNPSERDSFAYLFYQGVLSQPEYRAALLKYLNAF